MWTQIKTLIGLRLLLLKRLWFRSAAGVIAGLLAVLSMLIFGAVAIGVGLGCFALGWEFLPSLSPRELLLAGDLMVVIVLALWIMGLLSELQRSDMIDFQKMLYLPVSLRMVFALNFTVSLASPLLVVYALGALGIAAGLTIKLGPTMLCILPLAVAFYLMLASWSYHLQGLLAALMENKRRRRFILTVIPITFVVLAQLPNVLTQSAMSGARHGRQGPQKWIAAIVSEPTGAHETDWLLKAHTAIPFAWLPRGIAAVRNGDFAVASLCLLGMAGIGALGMVAGYRATVRQYTGAGRRSGAPKKLAPAHRPETGAPFTARALPYIADDTCALVLASWLTLVRHPRIRIQMVVPLIMPILFAVPLALRHPTGNAVDLGAVTWGASLAFGGAMFYTFLSFAAFMCNHFGADQEGFQALVLLPTPRYKYLLAKNIAFFPLVGVPYLALSAGVAYFARTGVATYAATLIQFVQVYFSLSLLGNYLSLYFPYRFQRSSGQAARPKPAAFLGALITMFAIPVLMIPAGLCSLAGAFTAELGVLRYVPVGILASLLVTVLTIWAYRSTLVATGALLQLREQSILATLLKDKE